jgi:ubiquinone/menaquinone biosynthesis C-methylase UbiE
MDFNEISSKYEKDSLVQRNAADMLIDLLHIGPRDDILDLGCGTGGITKKLAGMTGGKVLGIDPSEGMIREAKGKHIDGNISFERRTAEDFLYPESFDVVFCNSAFQWFCDPLKALRNCYLSLRRNGRMGIQSPATREFCPNFMDGIRKVQADSRTSDIFSHFKSPWIFLETARDYEKIFEEAGFLVFFSRIEQTSSEHSPDEAFKIFESGAAAGYLNHEYYAPGKYSDAFVIDFRRIMKESFQAQANADGKLKMIFNRIYLIATKE